MMGNSDTIILDVRAPQDWKGSDRKITGAVREDPRNEITAWMDKYPRDKTIVLYCAWADEATSARVAQKLIANGYKKVYALKGGWNEWYDAKYPVEPK